jgi:hypothetical protein
MMGRRKEKIGGRVVFSGCGRAIDERKRGEKRENERKTDGDFKKGFLTGCSSGVFAMRPNLRGSPKSADTCYRHHLVVTDWWLSPMLFDAGDVEIQMPSDTRIIGSGRTASVGCGC